MRSQELATLGSTLVILGIVFGAEERLIGYSFIGVGALLAIVSSFKLRRKSRTYGPRAGGVKNGRYYLANREHRDTHPDNPTRRLGLVENNQREKVWVSVG